MRALLAHNQDSYAQQENDEVEILIQTADSVLSDYPEDEPVLFDEGENSGGILQNNVTPIMNDEEINTTIGSLNKKQGETSDYIIRWARNHIENLSCVQKGQVNLCYLFVTGDGGCSK